MTKSRRISRIALLLPLVASVLAGCSAKSPEERVAELRSNYRAQLLGFIVDAEPMVAELPEEVAGAEEPAEVDLNTDSAEGASLAIVEPEVPVRQIVRLDILLQHDSPEKLPGITLDVEMVDSNKVRKNSWKFWVDTSELPKATGTQFVHQLDDVDYVEGDGFDVEVRSQVPAEERGEYREFSAASGG